ncbi:unnamed protein product [Spirodela intermedia]|uniref:Peroxidase n=1 Tax=Spirodela intermedia TaxID=51605 RepID=A0A7I8JQQ5_SPIIN|nr:unnamed protein product [Spirodela intermedia]CAA6672509.1 unnamed protein product [Spirodela intermedia]
MGGSVAAALLGVVVVVVGAAMAEGKLAVDYYAASCPRAAEIVSETVVSKQIASPTTAAGTLRVFFHDCFLDGCDGSVLVSSTAFHRAERDADINLSLPGDAFDLVVRAKTAVELACPASSPAPTSSPSPPATSSPCSAAPSSRPPRPQGQPRLPCRPRRRAPPPRQRHRLPAHRAIRAARLLGAGARRAVRRAHRRVCALQGVRSTGGPGRWRRADAAAEPRYAEAVRRACADYRSRPTVAVFNDVMTPNKFDNVYFQNLRRGMGLTRPFVELYAADEGVFFRDFARAIEKLSVYGVKTGGQGEVRRRCDQFNGFTT